MDEAGNAVQAMKPVFMMSPLSLAAYLPPGKVAFDFVIFDEASQIKPVDAFGAILRGSSTVVVGDSRQLPPTSFFEKAVEEEDKEWSESASDLESVLGLFTAKGAAERMLRWHYRSEHESLICVSNHEFYNDELVVFPSPNQERTERGLEFRYLPDTCYSAGQRRAINEGEARYVAKEVMKHARSFPNLTLGVAAFSKAQAETIQDQLELLRRHDPSLEKTFFSRHGNEPFFVKNLENVQGDERDVIFISVGYGRREDGWISMNFGPLNAEGGERRLNVLITRAKWKCVVFTNLRSDDLDLRRTNARGVAVLKTFLKYAETGVIGDPRPTGRGPDNDF